MGKKTVLPLLAILLHLASFSQANSQNLLKTWDVFELTLVSKSSSSNPYLEIVPGKTPFLTARFTGTDGLAAGQSMTVPGFWDGERTWKIKFANSKGITVWIHAWWSREGISKSIGEENIIRWWRYVVQRLHAYNVIWVIAGEYNMNDYGGFPLEFWNGLGKIIKDEDPYERIMGAHPTPPMWSGGADAPQWSTAEAIHDQQWSDYNQGQTGHARWCNELTPWIITNAYNRKPAKPVVVTEPWYEFIEGNPTAMDIRFGAWSAVMSGAAGHSYGGGHIWRVHLPERPTGVGSWPMDTSFATNTMLYPGAVSVGFMGKFLRNLDWWKLEPHPELVPENPSPYCLADPGREYLFYLSNGGSVKIDLTAYPGSSEFEFTWTDLVNSRESKKGVISGGSVTEIKCPEDYPGTVNFKDWLLYVVRTDK